MQIILTKDYKKPNGSVIKKGEQVNFFRTLAAELIDKKEARPLNLIEKTIKKIKDKKENAKFEQDSEKATK